MAAATMRVTPFGFDRVFNGAAEAPPVDPGVAAAAEQVAALRAALEQMTELHRIELQHARADAFAAGLQQASGERDAALLAAVDALQDALSDIDERLVEAADTMKHDAADVALAAAEMLAGHAVAAAPALAIDDALGRVLRQVARGTRIDVHVHSTLLEEVSRCVETRKSEERRKLAITVLANDALAPGDARISWEEGGLTVAAAARRQAVLDELVPLLGTSGADLESDPAHRNPTPAKAGAQYRQT